jgi:hypothetical protein
MASWVRDLQQLLLSISELIDRTDELSTRHNLLLLRSQLQDALEALLREEFKGKVLEDESLRMAFLEARESLDAALIRPNKTEMAIEAVWDVGKTLLTLSRLTDTFSPLRKPPAPTDTVTKDLRTRSRKGSGDFEADEDIAPRDMPVTARKRGGSVGTASKNAKSQVECKFRAEMDSEVVVNKRVSVDVTIARYALAVTPGRTGDTGEAKVDIGKKLIVQIAERRNFRVDGERRVEIDVPGPDEDATVSFDVTGVIAGEGELWVQVRQGPVPLVTLKLKPRIVAKAKRGPAERLPVEQSVAAIPPVQPALDRLTIQEGLVGNDVQYHYVLELPTLGILKYFKSAVIEGRDEYIVRLLNSIGDAWAGTGKDQVAAFETDLKSIGATMFTNSCRGKCRRCFGSFEEASRVFRCSAWSHSFRGSSCISRIRAPPSSATKANSWGARCRTLVVRKLPSTAGDASRRTRPLRRSDIQREHGVAYGARGSVDVQRIFNATPVVPARPMYSASCERRAASISCTSQGHAEAASADQADARLLLDELNDGSTENVLKATTVEQTAQLAYDGPPPDCGVERL